MINDEKTIRKTIVEAGARLCGAGLTERTWGNISARLDGGCFIITPSGRAYEDTLEEDLVRVSLSDLSHDGRRLPSSEKAMHAAIYRLRPDVGFILHTHQTAATVCACAGDLELDADSMFGPLVPCAEYALPSTVELAERVAEAAKWAPRSSAVLMRGHGVVCFAGSCEEAFSAALELERICAERLSAVIPDAFARERGAVKASTRAGDGFFFNDARGERLSIADKALSGGAAFHAAAYRAVGARYVVHLASAPVLAVSARGETLLPYVDDLAQIAGEDIQCARDESELADKLRGRAAVLLRGRGAICVGDDAGDAEAAASILEKNCLAALFSERCGGEPISSGHARRLREVYLTSYSKRKTRK